MKLSGTSRSVRSHWSLCFQPIRTDWLLGWWNERISQEAEFLTQPPALPPPWLQSNRNPLISVQERSICLQSEQRIYRNWKCANFRNLKSLPAVSHFIQRRNLSSKRWCEQEKNYIGCRLLTSRPGIAIYLQIIWTLFRALIISGDMLVR